jgi:thymidylate kinase
MPLYYITGVSGSGKSTVLAELKRRGLEAYGTDEDNLAAFYHTETGTKTPAFIPAEARTQEWRKYHEWKVPVETIEKLRRQATHHPFFFCGVVANDAEFWDKFEQVFCLYVPPEEIKRRIEVRADNDFGKNPHELATILEWAAYSKKQYEELGALLIDGTQSTEKIVDEILAQIA